MSAPKAEEAPKGAGGGGGPMPMVAVLVGVLNLAAVGFVGFTMMKLGKTMTAAAAGLAALGEEKGVAVEGGEGQDKSKKGEELPSVEMDPFVVNLNEPGSNRYLKASLEVEVEDTKTAEELKKLKHAVRDDLLRYLSSLSVADTQGEAAKAKMEETMMARIDKQLGGKEKVHRLFFNDFMVQ